MEDGGQGDGQVVKLNLGGSNSLLLDLPAVLYL